MENDRLSALRAAFRSSTDAVAFAAAARTANATASITGAARCGRYRPSR